MATEEHAEQVVNLSFIPIRAFIQRCDRGHRCCFVGVGLNSQSAIMSNTEHVINYLKSVILGWEVDSCDIGYHGVLGCGVVLQEGEDRDYTLRTDVDAKFILPDGELLDVFRQTGHEVLAVIVEGQGGVGVLGGLIDDGGGQLAHCCRRCQYLCFVVGTGDIRGRGALRSSESMSGGACRRSSSADRDEELVKARVAHRVGGREAPATKRLLPSRSIV